jgi:hypothetical protein
MRTPFSASGEAVGDAGKGDGLNAFHISFGKAVDHAHIRASAG